MLPVINSIVTEGAGVMKATSWHNNGLTGSGVKIGVIDSGFQGYSSLLGNELPASTKIKVFGSESDFNSNEHGTACAEIVYDIAPDAEFYLVNVSDISVGFNNAVTWLQSQGVDIISSSIAINLKIYSKLPGAKYYARVFQWWAVPQEIFLLMRHEKFPSFRHFNPVRTIEIGAPAPNPNVITVGAVPYNDPTNIEVYSSQSPAYGIIKPDLAAPDIVSTESYGINAFRGTSAAAPHVAGVCALVKEAKPDWSPEQIKNFLESNAQDLSISGKDNTYGSGLVAFPDVSAIIPQSPNADAGRDKIVVKDRLVTLNGSKSSAPNNDIVSYLWIQIGGPSVNLPNNSAINPSFISPDVGPEGITLTFQLTVADRNGLQDTDILIVEVREALAMPWLMLLLDE